MSTEGFLVLFLRFFSGFFLLRFANFPIPSTERTRAAVLIRKGGMGLFLVFTWKVVTPGESLRAQIGSGGGLPYFFFARMKLKQHNTLRVRTRWRGKNLNHLININRVRGWRGEFSQNGVDRQDCFSQEAAPIWIWIIHINTNIKLNFLE